MVKRFLALILLPLIVVGCATVGPNQNGSITSGIKAKKCKTSRDESLFLSTGSAKCVVDISNLPPGESYPVVGSKEINFYELDGDGCRTGKVLSFHGTDTFTRDPVTECGGSLTKDIDGRLVLKCAVGDKLVCQMRKETGGKVSWVTGYGSTMSMTFVGASKVTKDGNWTLSQKTSAAGIAISLTDLDGNLHRTLLKGKEFNDWNFDWEPEKN